MNYVAIS